MYDRTFQRLALSLLCALGSACRGQHEGGRADASADASGVGDAASSDAGDAGGSDAGGADAGTLCGAARTVPALTTETVGGTFAEPVFLAPVPGTSDLAVVERGGRIRIVRGDAILPDDFLTIPTASMLDANGYTAEQGLLGLAFHPDYATNGRFFVFRTSGNDDPGGRQNLIVEYARSSADPDLADATPVGIIVAATGDPNNNHNGGMLLFGPDGMLYAGIGDGGGGEDAGHGPTGNALNTASLFGKLLRVDVDAPVPYVPADPAFDGTDGNAYVYSFGLRNPWRFSIDPETNTLFVGDVGQYDYEEIDAVDLGAARRLSFNWAIEEGLHATGYPHIAAPANYSTFTKIDPILEVAHGGSILGGVLAIVGGYVYRGGDVPALRGFYLFGDIQGAVGALRFCEGRAADVQLVPGLSGGGTLNSFAVDADRELYLLHASSVVRVVAAP